nr:uncharacterized protein LOC105059991 isoform X1 [Elaeis guineensis]
MLERVSIDRCQELESIGGLCNLHSLEELKISFCRKLRLLSEEGMPSKLQNLHIEGCRERTSLLGMQNLASLTQLAIKACPKLQIMLEDQLPSMPRDVEIIYCPGLVNWCEIQKINSFQVASSGNKLTISNTWEKIMHGFDDLTSIKHLPFANSWHSLRETFSISNSWRLFAKTYIISILEELTIWGCTDIPPIRCLPELTVLRSLVIKDCPGIQVVTDELLPRTLNSLVVDSCEDLRCLQLARQNRDALEVLLIVNCPRLTLVEGLNCIFFPKFLTIEQCPQLLLPHSGSREQRNN